MAVTKLKKGTDQLSSIEVDHDKIKDLDEKMKLYLKPHQFIFGMKVHLNKEVGKLNNMRGIEFRLMQQRP